MAESNDRLLARDYLLRRISDEQRETVGRRIFEEEGFLELVEDVEDELIDLYASGELEEVERQEVEKHILSQPQARERLQLSRDLMQVKASAEQRRIVHYLNWRSRFLTLFSASPRKLYRWTLATAATLLLAVLLALLWNVQIAKDGNHGLDSKAPDLVASSSGEPEKSGGEAGNQFQGVFALLLSPAGLRSAAGIPTFDWSSSVEWLELRIPVEEEDQYPAYRMVLQKPDGSTIAGSDRLQPERLDGLRLIRFRLRTDRLVTGRWEAGLLGLTSEGLEEPLSYSYFEVKKTN